MEIRQLRYFVAICETGSFSKAARVCFISHQGISLAMMRLEDELGGKLFRRTMKGIELTPDAAWLLPRAQEILRIADECENVLQRANSGARALRVWCAYGVIQEFADPLLTDFKEAHPDIRLTVKEDSDLACDYALESGEAELAISIGPVDANKFIPELFFSNPAYSVAALVHESHPFAGRDVLRIEELRNVPLVMMDENTKTYQQLTEVCRRAGFAPVIDTTVGDTLTVYYYAQANRMVGITPTCLARRLSLPGVVAVPFDTPQMAWEGWILYKKGASLSDAAQAFLAMARDYRAVERSE